MGRKNIDESEQELDEDEQYILDTTIVEDADGESEFDEDIEDDLSDTFEDDEPYFDEEDNYLAD